MGSEGSEKMSRGAKAFEEEEAEMACLVHSELRSVYLKRVGVS